MIAAGFQAIYHPTPLLPPGNQAKPPPKVSGKEFCSPDSFIFRVLQQRVVLRSQGLHLLLGRQRCSMPSTNTLHQRKAVFPGWYKQQWGKHPQSGVVCTVKYSPYGLRSLLGTEPLLPATPVGDGLEEGSWYCDYADKKIAD